jgi:hypothetical protein
MGATFFKVDHNQDMLGLAKAGDYDALILRLRMLAERKIRISLSRNTLTQTIWHILADNLPGKDPTLTTHLFTLAFQVYCGGQPSESSASDFHSVNISDNITALDPPIALACKKGHIAAILCLLPAYRLLNLPRDLVTKTIKSNQREALDLILNFSRPPNRGEETQEDVEQKRLSNFLNCTHDAPSVNIVNVALAYADDDIINIVLDIIALAIKKGDQHPVNYAGISEDNKHDPKLKPSTRAKLNNLQDLAKAARCKNSRETLSQSNYCPPLQEITAGTRPGRSP